MKKALLFVVVCFALVMGSQSSFAQDAATNRAGFLLAFASGDIDEIGIGGLGEFKVGDKVTISPQLIFYFPDDNNGRGNDWKQSFLEINGNVHYYFFDEDIFEIYGLAGLNFARWSYEYNDGFGNEVDDSGVELGLNLGAGMNFDIGKNFVPFAELRLTVGEFDQFVLSTGLKFNLGK